jgi:uncharacterized repeat protein (TIGR01451 family)
MNKFLLYGVVTTVLVLTLALIPAPIAKADPGLVTEDLDSGLTPTDLADILLGDGIIISNVSYAGVNCAAGNFSGGAGIIGFEKGIILSSGDIAKVVGSNDKTGATKDNYAPGDSDLETLIPGYTTNDAAVLEFDFIPSTNIITFEYVFGSEEYNEYVGSPYNDVFGFFVNGNNVALLPGAIIPVSINSVNCANNSAYYIDSDPIYSSPCYGGIPLDTQLDGLTVILQVTTEVIPGVENHIKLAIADVDDGVLDSDVFIKAGSFISYNPLNLSKTDGLGEGECLNPGDPITYTISYENKNDNPVSNVVITDKLPDEVDFVNATRAYTENGQELTFNIGLLESGASGSIEITGTIDGATPKGASLINTCTIDSAETNLVTFYKETPVCNGPGPGPEPEVGGTVQSVNKLVLLTPWLTLAILLASWSTIIIWRHKAQR